MPTDWKLHILTCPWDQSIENVGIECACETWAVGITAKWLQTLNQQV